MAIVDSESPAARDAMRADFAELGQRYNDNPYAQRWFRKQLC